MQRLAARCLQHGTRRRFSLTRLPAAVNTTAEADSGCVAALVVLAGVGTAACAYVGSRRQTWTNSSDKLRHELLEPRDFRELRRSGCSVTYAYTGSDPHWKGVQLRLRHDDTQALATDRVAAHLLAEGFALESELVAVDAEAVEAVLHASSPSMASSAQGKTVVALKVGGCVPEEAREGSMVTMQLRPGSGVMDLYGSPGAFALQEDSEMRRDALSRAGKYSARDIFSGRGERVYRALHALRGDPQDVLRVLVDGEPVHPAGAGADAAVQTALGIEGGLGLRMLLGLLADCLDGEGKVLLMALLRAQCSAGVRTNDQARQLEQIYRHHSHEETSLVTPKALKACFARGFWTLSPDDSGKTTREREGERLLERARRELWKEGSASRQELEAQVRIFLCRNLLGRAATNASVQLSVVRARPGSTDILRSLRFTPSTAAPELWWRLDLLDLELPPEKILRT